MASSTVAVIPARYDSQRFPAKPLADIAGVPMIIRVARRARAAASIDRVLVATDDDRIADVVRAADFEVAMTSSTCPSGSDRVAEAVAAMPEAPSLVVNVQGDEPLVDPRDIDALVDAAQAHPDHVATLARPLPDPADYRNPHAVKVVTDLTGGALYFSRGPIPHGLDGAPGAARLHVGLYAYSPAVLARFTRLAPSPLETVERLEQLRALENGIPIHVTMCVSERPSIAVDVPADLAEVLRALEDRMEHQD